MSQIYEPYGVCRDFIRCRDRFVLFIGKMRSGKTLAAESKLYMLLSKYSGSRGLMIRKIRATMAESCLQTWEDEVVPEGHPILLDNRGHKVGRTGRTKYQFPNGSELVVQGLNFAQSIQGSEYDWICVSQTEELSKTDIGFLTGRLSGTGNAPYQQLLMDANPLYPWHWLNQDDMGITKFWSRFEDNPNLYDQKTGEQTPGGKLYLESLQRSMSGAQYTRLYLGKFAAEEGSVYGTTFNDDIHVIEPFNFEDCKDVKVAIDWGYRDPCVIQVWGTDADKRMYLIKEYYKTEMTNADIIGKLNDYKTYNYSEIIADSSEPGSIEELNRAGLNIKAAKKGPGSIKAGIKLLLDRMRVQGDGKPRLFLFADYVDYEDQDLKKRGKPTNFRQEIDAYLWAKGNKDEPVDANNHSMDAARYLCSYLDDSMEIYTPTAKEFFKAAKHRSREEVAAMNNDGVWSSL